MINAILGRLDVFGTIVEFTRQEAAIVHCLQQAPFTSKDLCKILYGDYTAKCGKVLGVHMFNLRQKLPSGVSIVFDAMRNVYVMGKK